MNLNWLLWIPGWFFGFAVVNRFVTGQKVKSGEENNFTLVLKIVMWTLTWIWICWRFIH